MHNDIQFPTYEGDQTADVNFRDYVIMIGNSYKKSIGAIEEEILEYLRDHPHAGDTVEGIAR